VSFTLAFALQLRKINRKTSVRVKKTSVREKKTSVRAKNLSQGKDPHWSHIVRQREEKMQLGAQIHEL
jgi:uncharacterized membrane protein